MTIKQTKLATIRAFTIGFSASLLVLACGSDDDNGGANVLVEEPPAGGGMEVDDDRDVIGSDVGAGVQEGDLRDDIDNCEANPLLAGCPGVGGEDEVEDVPPGGEFGLAQTAAENILEANCGQCHGSQIRNEADAEAGMNYIDDLSKLLDEGQAIGGDAENSPIIRRMRSGSMPPAASNGPRPSDADVDIVANFLDNPVFFPDDSPGNCEGQLIEFDDIYRQLQTDILGVDDDDQPFTRYLLLTNRFNQGICAGDLDGDRFGMNKMLNMLSINTRVKQGFAINQDETIYRIDIRDYDWDRDIEVDGVNFDDGWDAIVDANIYATEFEGQEAEQVILTSETEVPWMYADSMVDVASIGNLYYALVDVDVDVTLDDFILDDLDIDVDDNLDQEELIRAGTTKSIISRQDRVAERHDIGVRQGAFWQSFDFDDDNGNESIFDDPFGFAEGGSEAIFTLPNGFLAYIIADADRNIVEESDILFDTRQNDFKARTSVSCSGCHAQGFLPMVDEVRGIVENNRFNFNADDFEAVREVYPRPDEFAAIVERDSSDFQRRLTEAGVPTNIADPMQGVFLEFDKDMSLDKVSGDLGVSQELLQSNIAALDPSLQIVRDGNGSIDRDDFTDIYLASLCVMQTSSQNQPLVDDCADAIAALDD